MAVRGRRVAFDVGDVRTGVAISDPDGILATPHSTLQSKNPALLKEIKEILFEIDPIHIYVGLPRLMSGGDGSAVAKAEAFVEKLRTITDVEISFVDERLSTVSASRQLEAAGVKARNSRSIIDAAAAVTILEQGLAISRKSEEE